MTHAPHLLSLGDLANDEIASMLDLAKTIKSDPAAWSDACRSKTMVMLFEKPSLRTRVSFEAGFGKLGGNVVYLDHQGSRIGAREPVEDYGRNLERWTDVIVARTFAHETLEALAAACAVPVINALSDRFHPCQALADMLTLDEHVGLEGAKLAYVGDGNNVCHSLLLACASLGVTCTVISPPSLGPSPGVVADAVERAAATGATIHVTDDLDAVSGHDAVYTDTWVSMGQEDEESDRHAALAAYQVDAGLMAKASEKAIFMHCLPAHRGCEVAAEVIDGPSSVVFDQAENRLHAQNGVLVHLLGASVAPVLEASA